MVKKISLIWIIVFLGLISQVYGLGTHLTNASIYGCSALIDNCNRANDMDWTTANSFTAIGVGYIYRNYTLSNYTGFSYIKWRADKCANDMSAELYYYDVLIGDWVLTINATIPGNYTTYTNVIYFENSGNNLQLKSKIRRIGDFCVGEGCCYYSRDFELNLTYFENTFLNYTFKDSNTKQLITDNITVQIISDDYVNSSTCIYGNTNNTIPWQIYGTDDTMNAVIRSFSTNNNDYSIVILNKVIDFEGVFNLTIYLTNTSDIDATNLVTFHVVDETGQAIESATVQILKQDPSTNTYNIVTELTTGPNGEATTILVADTIFYRFNVIYNSDIIYTSLDPITISVNDDDIYIVGIIDGRYTEPIDVYYNVVTQLNFYNYSQYNGNFSFTWASPETVEACLVINVINSTLDDETINSYCQNASNGILRTANYAPHNRTFFIARGYIDTKDGNGFRIVSNIAKYIGAPNVTFDKTEGVFFIIVVLLIAAFGFIANPIIGLLILSIGMLILSFTGLVTALSLSAIMIIISLSIISMFVISKKNE